MVDITFQFASYQMVLLSTHLEYWIEIIQMELDILSRLFHVFHVGVATHE